MSGSQENDTGGVVKQSGPEERESLCLDVHWAHIGSMPTNVAIGLLRIAWRLHII